MTYNPATGLPLTGTENLEVRGQNPAGIPAAATFTITTQDIANLAEAGSGNVVGPMSSVNGHIAVFSGVTGQLIADGGAVPASVRGTFVANGTTPVVVAAASIAAGTVVGISFKTLGGTQGAQPVVVSQTAGVGFSVIGTALDTSTYNYVLI